MRNICKILIAGLFFTAPGLAMAEGDADKGRKVFKKCAACHVVDSDKKKVGPSLQGIMGKTAGTIEGFKYSKAMRTAGEEGLVWTDETLTSYLANPKKMVKGTKMSFAGLKKDEDLANVIAYLKLFSPVE